MTLVVVDADVLGRRRTGDETYVRNLLRTLSEPAAEAGLDLAAVTRHPELVPDGVLPVLLPARSQELRMAWTLPRTLRRLGAALVHTQYALPFRCPCPAVVTIHDLSFEHGLMGRRDRLVFERVVPHAARTAARVLTVSERTKRDLVEHYGIPPERVVVTPNGVDPAFHPVTQDAAARPYALAVGAIQQRKNQRAALAAAREAGLELVVVGPVKDERAAAELRAGGARLEGYVDVERLAELYRGAACLVQASRYEGFGLPVVEAMASGTPVVMVPDPALVEVAGEAAVVVPEAELAAGIRRAVEERNTLAAAGLERARAFTWEAAGARHRHRVRRGARPMIVSAVVVSHGHARELEALVPLLEPQVDEVVVVANTPGSVPAALPQSVRVLENARPHRLAVNVNLGVAATTGEWVLFSNPDVVPAPDAVGVLHGFATTHPHCGIAGPRTVWPDGRWQPTRRSFPTVSGTLVRRTPLRRIFPPLERQTAHYHLDEDVDEPVEADWLLGSFLLLRRTMLVELGGYDEGYRHYVEDIDLCYRAMRAGWERWYVPAARVTHDWAQVTDKGFLSRSSLWHARSMARFVRRHPETLARL